ncbi:CotH kinase family protein [Candidatus Leptofilum sp.]|uniref:CotH kinase family protein n=1 Tax=Candidatus Leptofilum sp. TaxID=3241576 RepID=UPI003B590565
MRTQERHKHLFLAAAAILPALILLFWQSIVNPPADTGGTLQFSVPSGAYAYPLLLQISIDQGQGEIRYTLDGSEPITAGLRYQAPIPLVDDGVYVVRARRLLTNGELGPEQFATYIIGLETSLPLLSIIIEPEVMWGSEQGIWANPFNRGRAWEREAHLMFFEGGMSDNPPGLAFTTAAGLRIHGSASRGYPKKSLRIYFRNDYGNGRLDYPLYGENGRWDRLVLHAGGQDYAAPEYGANWTLLRAALLYDLAADTHALSAQTRPVLLFINGQLQGVYQLRTEITERYLEDYYGFQGAQLFTISGDLGSLGLNDEPLVDTNSTTNSAAISARDEWLTVLNDVQTNDLADLAVQAQLAERIDFANFWDYVILQMYSGNTDWLRNNVKQFRPTGDDERWRWLLWDVDYAFGLKPWSDVSIDMVNWLYTNEQPGFEQGASLLRLLLEQESYRNTYLVRLADLLNTTLAPDNVASRLDAMAAEMQPDMHFETDLWSSPGRWEGSVAEMRSYVLERPDFVRQHHIEGFNLGGLATITLIAPSTNGRLTLNNSITTSQSWQGQYFMDTTITITATPPDGYLFVGWADPTLPPEAQLSWLVTGDQTFQPIFERR